MENMIRKLIKTYREILWSARQLEDRMRGGAIQHLEHCMVEITPTGTVAINAIVCKTMRQEIVFVSCRGLSYSYKAHILPTLHKIFIGIANEFTIRSTQFRM